MWIIPAIWFIGYPFVVPRDDPEEGLSPPPAEVADVLGEDGVAAIKQARVVSIVATKAVDPQGGDLRVFVPAGPVRVLSPRVVTQLKKALLERVSYRAIAEAKLCGEFSPSLQIDFTTPGRPPFQLLVLDGGDRNQQTIAPHVSLMVSPGRCISVHSSAVNTV